MAAPRTRPRKQAKQDRSRATVEAILEGAARVLRSTGYDHASTNRIARTAGVSVGSLYQYFPSKEAIVAELIERHLERVFGAVAADLAGVAEVPLAEAVRRLVGGFFAVQAVDPELRRVFIEQVPRVGKLARFRAVEERVAALVRAYLETRRAEVRSADLELTAHVVVHTVAALTYQATLGPARFPRDALVEEISAMILRHLRG